MNRILFTLVLCLLSLAAHAEDAAKVSLGDYHFSLGDKWKSIEPSSPMRKATLQITPAGMDKPLEANFFQFGGDIDSNLQRWKGQVQGEEPKIENTEINGHKVTFYHATGTYNDPFGGQGPQADYALLGAMIPVEGAGPIVIKLAGPKDAVASVAEAFKAMVSSALPKK
jgi:hypothetical protein